MPPRRDPLYQSVSNAFSLEDLSESGREIASVLDEEGETNLPSPKIHGRLASYMGGVKTFCAGPDNVYLLVGIFVMLSWPWIFLATIWKQDGIQMQDNVAKFVKIHPQRTNFFITFLGNIVSLIVSIIFSTAVLRFSQEWATNNDHVTVFDVSLISAFRNQNWPWGIKDHKYLLVRKRWLSVVLAGACIAAFTLVPSGTTSLIAPVSFTRTWPLIGNELDLSSNVADCVDWFAANPLPQTDCEWRSFNGLRYIDCLANDHVINILDAGRSSIQSLILSDSEYAILGEIGPISLRFLGPSRGVIPIGPNGIRGLGGLQPSPLSDAEKNAAILSYNYTFDHQGFTSNISCIYDTQSPIRFSAVPSDTSAVRVNGSCNEIGLVDVPAPDPDGVLFVSNYRAADTNRTLTHWACKSIPTEGQYPAYYIYLRGRGTFYEKEIGNISCTISPIQPAVFPVTYQSSTGIFSTEKGIETSEPADTFSDLVEYAISVSQYVLRQAQTGSFNLVAGLVQEFGTQGLGVLSSHQDKAFLPVYEAMIEGILVDQLAYLRFLYSMRTDPPPPASCIRRVNGMFSAEVTGWVAKLVHIWFLMPMTILNLASLIFVLISIAKAKRGRYEFDPTDPRPLLLAEPRLDEVDHSGWSDSVLYRSRESVMFQRSTKNASE